MIDTSVEVLRYDTVVVGSGAAAFNAADWLYDLGRRNFCLLTEGVRMGTSRNTGSDKQTYYKLSIGSDGSDSVAEMAETLFEGEGVEGPIALAEAANSLRCFMKLANLGVDFPTDAYGQFVGYKTDHDPRQRATSAGPLTSKYMTEALERSVMGKGIEVLDQLLAYRIVTDAGEGAGATPATSAAASDTSSSAALKPGVAAAAANPEASDVATSRPHVRGVVCLDKSAASEGRVHVVVIMCNHVVWCTGGPAACYRNVVYPASQTGMTGAVLEAGAEGANLQEWQYGLASTKFRWNVSGTYQQVLPRYISVDEEGTEREFLCDYGLTPAEALDRVFLKGYQWPFDVTKTEGSSAIDLAVYEEVAIKGRRVYMDFRSNPRGLEDGFDALGTEAHDYLANSGALFGTPIERLRKMNPLAIQLYLDHGIDLEHEMLEVSVCAQHHNGGVRVDASWETAVGGLYVAGEAAGTFGVHRPGGSALNSTQVGSLRAAQHIAWSAAEHEPSADMWPEAPRDLGEREAAWLVARVGGLDNASSERVALQREMSRVAAQVRDVAGMSSLASTLAQLDGDFDARVGVGSVRQLPGLLKLRDAMRTQRAVLDAMLVSAMAFGSRGSALVVGEDGSRLPVATSGAELQTVTTLDADGAHSHTEHVEPIPVTDAWFENVWAEHRRERQPL